MDAIESFDCNGLVVNIYPDDSPESPRDWDNLGTMVCWHRRYNLGDEQPSCTPDDYMLGMLPDAVQTRLESWRERMESKIWAKNLRFDSAERRDEERSLESAYQDKLQRELDKVAVILPLYLYDHSGITMRTAPFSCPWDSGQVGFVYVTLADVRKEYSMKRVTKAIRAKAESALRQEVSTYDDYLTGSVYGYVVETAEGEHVDSCWGFYGLDYCKDEARAAASAHAPVDA